MKSPLNIGFISFAHGHTQAYAEVLHQYDDAHLVCAWDEDSTRAKNICGQLNMRVCDTVEEVLANPDVDAVIIGSETCYHEEHAIAAAKAGRHVLLQKPMAMSLEECDQIIGVNHPVDTAMGAPPVFPRGPLRQAKDAKLQRQLAQKTAIGPHRIPVGMIEMQRRTRTPQVIPVRLVRSHGYGSAR